MKFESAAAILQQHVMSGAWYWDENYAEFHQCRDVNYPMRFLRLQYGEQFGVSDEYAVMVGVNNTFSYYVEQPDFTKAYKAAQSVVEIPGIQVLAEKTEDSYKRSREIRRLIACIFVLAEPTFVDGYAILGGYGPIHQELSKTLDAATEIFEKVSPDLTYIAPLDFL